MILLDFGGVMHSTIAVELENSKATTCDISFLRYLILNSIRATNVKFSKTYGELVICVDSPHSWRKKFFPFYKANRSASRAKSIIDWNSIFDMVNQIVEEITENLPYRVIKLPELEADDIIGILALNYDKVCRLNVLDEYEKQCLIVSNDKDFAQLDILKHVKRYSPRQAIFKKEAYPEQYLLEHILNGDKSDGIPNVKSLADSFVRNTRQKPITSKFIQSVVTDGENALSTEEKLRYADNATLIDLTKIPDKYVQPVIDMFLQQKPKKNSIKLMQYFASKSLKKLLDKIEDF